MRMTLNTLLMRNVLIWNIKDKNELKYVLVRSILQLEYLDVES